MLVLTLLVSLIQLWFTIAYLYAYIQLRESLLLVQVGQGVAFGLLFVLISLAIATQQQSISGLFSGLLLLIGLVLGFIWRRRNGINLLIDYYPRAIIDVMLFKRAAEEKLPR
jgi:hypothetical protein